MPKKDEEKTEQDTVETDKTLSPKDKFYAFLVTMINKFEMLMRRKLEARPESQNDIRAEVERRKSRLVRLPSGLSIYTKEEKVETQAVRRVMSVASSSFATLHSCSQQILDDSNLVDKSDDIQTIHVVEETVTMESIVEVYAKLCSKENCPEMVEVSRPETLNAESYPDDISFANASPAN
ncbi:hypothetical protein HDU67_004526 [Dinochytrium kinnereticum]|nr:hypothetical protein HDU67_004526 [Dinochytrium kinnereticum]